MAYPENESSGALEIRALLLAALCWAPAWAHGRAHLRTDNMGVVSAFAKRHSATPSIADAIRALVWQLAPKMPARFKTSAQVSRFKRAQREFDQVVLDLKLATPASIQNRNSIVAAQQTVRLIDFDRAHATAAR